MSSESKKGYLKILAIILIFFIVLFFRSRVCERVIVNGQSMEPNFKDSTPFLWPHCLLDRFRKPLFAGTL